MLDYNTVPLMDIPAFIEWLNTLYPDRCPVPTDSEREIWMKAGERRCAESIIAKLNNMDRKKGD